MDQRFAELMFRHRHGDGSWGVLEPRPTHHDASEHDAERRWKDGQVYVCPSCDEQIQVGLDQRDDTHGR